MTRQLGAWLAAALLGLVGCSPTVPPAVPVPELPPEEVAVSLYLIGDAGAPDPRGDPVLLALEHDLRSRPHRRVVVFLGDNAYPRGLPAPGHPDRPESERRLGAQVEAVKAGGATGYFIPGNHDWARFGRDGWESVKRQQAFIDSAGAGATVLRPGGGCPGPYAVDLGRLRLVLLDTQWWLHNGPKPKDPTSTCRADSELEVVDSLRAALSVDPERIVVVAGHHPLASGGEHGGRFGLEDHLFPLRKFASWLWVPLPWLGSLYPAARQHGFSSQDVSSRPYQNLIRALSRAFRGSAPALYAAGHEHNLQVIKGGPARTELVSGTGFYGHTGRALAIEGTRFARRASGFARLDVPHRGPARLTVVEVDGTGRGREAYSTWVK